VMGDDLYFAGPGENLDSPSADQGPRCTGS